MFNLSNATTASLTNAYNAIAEKPVKKFESLAVARKRLEAAINVSDLDRDSIEIILIKQKVLAPVSDGEDSAFGEGELPEALVAAKPGISDLIAKAKAAIETKREQVVAAKDAKPARRSGHVEGSKTKACFDAMRKPEGATAEELKAIFGMVRSWGAKGKKLARRNGLTFEVNEADGVKRYCLVD